MEHIFRGLSTALQLLFSLDREVFAIAGTSLKLAVVSTAIATLLGMPIGFVIAWGRFPGQRLVQIVVNTLVALPTVVVGLVAYSLLSRQGPLGRLGLLYTLAAIVVGQAVLATPIIVAFTVSAIRSVDPRARRTALTLGASELRTGLTVLREARFALMAGVVAGFGRLIGEVGVSMMLGGNVRWYTRTITTAIALETSKGEFGQGIALGLILLALALGVNVLLQWMQGWKQ